MMKTKLKLWLLPLIWSVVGLFFIFEASVVTAIQRYADPYHFVKQQFIWLIVALGLFVLIRKLKWPLIMAITPYFFGLNLLLLGLVFMPYIGLKIGGARRWLNLGFASLQPSELLKISLLTYLALWLSRAKRSFTQFLFLISISAGLVLLEPDMSTTLLILTTAVILFFLYYAHLKPFLFFSVIFFCISLILILSSPYRRQRLTTLINPYKDRLGTSYQVNQITIALGRGGLFGQGLGQSDQRYLYLPASFTDTIMAIIGEEVGFIGLSALIFSYLIFLYQTFKVAGRLTTISKQIIIYGVGLIVFIQMMINFGGMVAIIPLTGITLPFISYGGSSLVSLWVLIAIGQSALDSTD